VYQKELARGLDQSGLQKGHREIVADHMQYLEKSGRVDTQFADPLGPRTLRSRSPEQDIWPRPTPLRNSIPRVKGQGSVRCYKIVSAIFGSGTGGLSTINPGIAENANMTTPTGQSLVRGPAISYAGFDVAVSYVTSSLSLDPPMN
jgi:hypothetical protein